MPVIGKANENFENPYSNIKIGQARVSGENATPKRSVGDSLNQIAGNRPESRFVDRRSKEELGQDGFMKLLAHQLKNQDPMKPMDQKDMSSNLAQFSQLEQLTSMNKKMDGLTNKAIDEKRSQAASFLGKKVITNGTSLEYAGDGKDLRVPFLLDRPAKYAVINILDDKRQLVARIEKENLPKGMQEINWDGMGIDGQLAPKDTYAFEVIAFDANNEKFQGTTKSEGMVLGVHFEDGETVLDLQAGKKVFLRDVQSFSLPDQVSKAPTENNSYRKEANNAYNKIESAHIE